MKNQLEEWGCNYTTAGVSYTVASCPNKPQRPVTPDILVYDVDQEVLSQFDCIFVCSGAHYLSLSINTDVLNIINMAYEEGLVIASICSGSVPIAHADGIVEGVKVAYFFLSTTKMQEEGAIEIYGSSVVSDKRIITTSSGMPYGSNAPVYQTCVALTKEVLGYSALVDVIIEPHRGGIDTNYTLTVEVNDLTDIYYGNTSTEVTTVELELQSDDETITGYYLTKISNNFYACNITGLEEFGNYQIDLEINSYGYGKEIIRDVTSFAVRKLAPGFELYFPLVSLSVIWFVIKARRKNGATRNE